MHSKNPTGAKNWPLIDADNADQTKSRVDQRYPRRSAANSLLQLRPIGISGP
jgi:hypothetical protein